MMLLQAVEEVLGDKGFQLPTPLAAATLGAARSLLAWCQAPKNHHHFTVFASSLHTKLHKPFDISGTTKLQRMREKMWGTYHIIRCSDDFVVFWKRFLTKASCEAIPILYQNITDRVFRRRMKVAFPVVRKSSSTISSNFLRIECAEVCCWVCLQNTEDVYKYNLEEEFQLKSLQLVSLWSTWE